MLIAVSKVCLDMGWHILLFAFEITRAIDGAFFVIPDTVPTHSAKFELYIILFRYFVLIPLH